MVKRVIIWGIVLLLIGGTTVYALMPSTPIIYHDVVVPAPRIIQREVPGPTTIKTKILYKYVHSVVTAHAPGGAEASVEKFCAPVVAKVQGDTAKAIPAAELIRSAVYTPSMIPLKRGHLFVSSETNLGTLNARDYNVRNYFGIGTGDSVVVRYGRFSVLKELGKGFLWYLGYRVLEFGIHTVINTGVRSPASSGLLN